MTSSSGAATDFGITTNYYGDHYSPALSPDRTRLAYVADFRDGSHRVVVGTALPGAIEFTNVSTVYCGNPSWSRSGGAIAYTKALASTLGGSSYVGFIYRTGTNVPSEVRLTSTAAYSNRCAFPMFYPRPTTWHVSADGDDGNLGANWSSPLRTIQRAVDLAYNGDTVIVSNGLYADGGMRRATNAHITRAYIYRQVTVQSLAGPAHTIIAGNADPVSGGNGTNAARCAFVTNGAALVGFTLSNGYTALGPYYFDRVGAAALLRDGGLLSNCIVTANLSSRSAVACIDGGTVLDCVISNNLGTGLSLGGGNALAARCVIAANRASGSAGGVDMYDATLRDCLVALNIATNSGDGGGVHASDMSLPALVERCVIRDNVADAGGGGVYADGENIRVRSCLITGNAARYNGGGVYLLNDATLESSTVSGNRADDCGGVYIRWHGTNINCIIFGNMAPTNSEYGVDAFGVAMLFCSTMPDANGLPGSFGNITNDPRFVAPAAGDFQLAMDSPCINTGTNIDWMGTATDLFGTNRILYSVVDMGAYEYPLPEPATAGAAVICSVLFVIRKRSDRSVGSVQSL